jgi:hypothetical protein
MSSPLSIKCLTITKLPHSAVLISDIFISSVETIFKILYLKLIKQTLIYTYLYYNIYFNFYIKKNV